MNSYRAEMKKVKVKTADYEQALENAAYDLIRQLKSFCQTYGEVLHCLDQFLYKPKTEQLIAEYSKKLVKQEINSTLLK
ncbi:hypothetical protein HOO54_22230 [Bacillus sp. WMMC1349]|uniref:hypothetical protein n=1 Tax=Bacillus sp. WMMC1349 TaxID=2736254 RepID=UPI00155473CC|nr:hypothetical protein [Bacillus sp. WMMC1349]NPC94816.1 hypothetical protein [Bacillus sp. WMMC1349]NPC94864.1 hypothetical protein [Bacillus sp. WMMC1349]